MVTAPPARLVAALVFAMALPGCRDAPVHGSAGSPRTDGGPAPRWTVGSEALLRIGVVEGESPYQLHRVTGAVRLPDGGVAVANAGSGEIRFFDASGRFLRASGRRGDGPGEWRGPDRVRLLDGDTLLVLDDRLRREGRVSTDGRFLGGAPMRDDVVFPSDQWLHGRFVVDSPLPPERRGIVVPALGRMGADSGSARLARVTAGARIWTTAWEGRDAPTEWIVHDLEGREVARVATPARFQLHDQGEDWIVGVVRDSLDVEYVEILPLDRGGEAYDPGALRRAAAESGEPPPLFNRVAPSTSPDLNSAMKQVASLQEIHYAEHLTYTVDLEVLSMAFRPRFQLPEGVAFEPLRADRDGWMARLVGREDGQGCLLSYGRFGLVGVPAGTVICWAAPPGRTTTG